MIDPSKFSIRELTFHHSYSGEWDVEGLPDTIRRFDMTAFVSKDLEDDEEDEETETYTGTLSAYLISRETTFDDFNDCPGHIFDMWNLLFSHRSSILEEAQYRSILFLHEMVISPEIRGHGLGLYMIYETCKFFSELCSVAIMLPCPMNEPDKQKETEGRKKLIKYYKPLKFKPVGKTGFFCFNFSRPLPKPPMTSFYS